ncbi:MAG TPA: hypothetical protein VMZ53_10030 [Kofleriaceae bacterium]|nr:hypothetical protein [Kofleriaceae bacterium]
MKRASRIQQDPRKRIERQRRLLRDAGEQLEVDDAELEEIDTELARRMLELES